MKRAAPRDRAWAPDPDGRIAWPILSRSGLGRLPGDVVIHRDNTSSYFPLVTCLVVSIVPSALFWLFNR
jgi:hypothetical protein